MVDLKDFYSSAIPTQGGHILPMLYQSTLGGHNYSSTRVWFQQEEIVHFLIRNSLLVFVCIGTRVVRDI